MVEVVGEMVVVGWAVGAWVGVLILGPPASTTPVRPAARQAHNHTLNCIQRNQLLQRNQIGSHAAYCPISL